VGAEPQEVLCESLGHRFVRPEILTEALSHPSLSPTAGGQRIAYDRLEFLGDRVLGVVVSDDLLRRYRDADVGSLAPRFNALVRQEALVRVATEITLGRFIEMSATEEANGGRAKATILADCCEAVIGALFLDGGLEAAAGFIHRHWDAMADALAEAPQDAKTALQEWAQAQAMPPPTYAIVKQDGPPHQTTFTVIVSLDGRKPESATGRSRRSAEQSAARAMLANIGDHG
jgi:ribonuclease-3